MLPKELDSLCDYMANRYPRSKRIKYTVLLGQNYTKQFKQNIKDSLGGMIVVSCSYFNPLLPQWSPLAGFSPIMNVEGVGCFPSACHVSKMDNIKM